MMKFFISDLHLGCGDALEDFCLWDQGGIATEKKADCIAEGMKRMHKAFSEFIDHIIRKGKEGDAPPELIFLGDTFDLLQVLQIKTLQLGIHFPPNSLREGRPNSIYETSSRANCPCFPGAEFALTRVVWLVRSGEPQG